MTKTLWSEIFRKIAETLVKQFNNDQTAGYELYMLLSTSQIFIVVNGSWAERLSKSEIKSIDPIALFASLNNFSIKEVNRLERINHLLDVLNAGIGPYQEGEVDFRGCPTPLAIHLMSTRPLSQQQEIWHLFRTILNEGKSGLSKNNFSIYENWTGISIPSFTIFLFWIDSKNFLPLDKNTVSLLIAKKLVNATPETFEEYYTLISNPLIPNPVQFSIEAFESRISSSTTNIDPLSPREKSTGSSPSKNFRLLGINILQETNVTHRKVLKTDHIYPFYQAFTFVSKDEIHYYPQKDIQLYNRGRDPLISISAIVGQNGSGKSTLTEVLSMAINNIAAFYNESNELEYVNKIHTDLYYNSEHLYKISVHDNNIAVYRYHFDPALSVFSTPRRIPLGDFYFENFFYSTYINYSLYALNSRLAGKWLTSIFKKEDEYDIPIGITPHRIEGNININKEHEQISNRLLSNLLSLKDIESEDFLLRRITDTRIAESIELTYYLGETSKLYKYKKKSKGETKEITCYFDKATSYWKFFIQTICKVFDIQEPKVKDDPRFSHSPIHLAFQYALKKIIQISIDNQHYTYAFNPKRNKFNSLYNYILSLKNDNSHITYEFKQAVYFIKYTHIRKHTDTAWKKEGTIRIPIKELAEDISLIMAKENNFKTILFSPPPFFKKDIILENEIPFSEISSGEKQKIYAISSLLFHLHNLDSKVSGKASQSFRNVHIFFDEVELYFHPEMQRTFINTLLSYLQQVPFEFLTGINITFITHSPFILSDIPCENILYMQDNNHIVRSFGANIHDLLASSFFLQSSVMGEFARRCILDLADYLSKEKISDSSLLSQEKWTKELAKQTINLIGEPLLRERLQKMYDKKFDEDHYKKARIAYLKDELNKLGES